MCRPLGSHMCEPPRAAHAPPSGRAHVPDRRPAHVPVRTAAETYAAASAGSSSLPSFFFGYAPITVFTGWPPLKRIIVGIESTWKRAAVCGFSSMSSLTIFRSSRSDWISSRTGATTRQGPHHGAQKSTSTGLSASSTSASKLLSVIWGRLPAILVLSSRGGRYPLYKMKGPLPEPLRHRQLPLSLRRQRARVGGACRHPAIQLALRLQALRSHAQPPVHRAAAHLETGGVRLGDERVRLGRIAAQQQASLAASADREVAADQERQAAE